MGQLVTDPVALDRLLKRADLMAKGQLIVLLKRRVADFETEKETEELVKELATTDWGTW